MKRVQNCRQNFDPLLLVRWLRRLHVEEMRQDQLVLLPVELRAQRPDASDGSLKPSKTRG